MKFAEAPHISAVRPNSPPFRAALQVTCDIVNEFGMPWLNAYSLHDHHRLKAGHVTYTTQVAPGKWIQYPLEEEGARSCGLPYCWRVTPHGIIVRRYAPQKLHKASGIDVTSTDFLEDLARIARKFVAQGVHQFLELNIADQLFPRGKGQITCEKTDERTGFQEVTLIDTPREILDNDWWAAACFSFAGAVPTVAGICSGAGAETHERRENERERLSRDASSATLEDNDDQHNK